MEDETNTDAYAVVLADLRRKRAQIDQAIAAIEGLSSDGSGADAAPLKPSPSRKSAEGGSLLGMTIADAAKKVLEARHNTATTPEIVSALEAGGVVLTSADKNNTVGSILLRRFYNVGDIVRVNRGVWGLQEWYPGRKFAKGSKVGEEKEPSDSKEESEEDEMEQDETDFDLTDDSPQSNEEDDCPF